jgi:hypothetical protein
MLMIFYTAMGTKSKLINPATGLSYPLPHIPSCDGNTTIAARV